MHGFGVDTPISGCCELIHEVPATKKPDAVGDLAGTIHVMRDHQDGLAGIRQPAYQVVELINGGGVQS